MKRCNCEHPDTAGCTPGPVQYTGSSLYPDVGPRPAPMPPRPPCPCPPMPPCPCPPTPVPEPFVVTSMLKDVYIEGIGNVIVNMKDDVYEKYYTIAVKDTYKLVPYTVGELDAMFDPIDRGA